MTGDEVRIAYASGRRDFRGVNLSEAILEGVDLRGADLRGADLRRAKLFEVKLGPHAWTALVHSALACGVGLTVGASLALTKTGSLSALEAVYKELHIEWPLIYLCAIYLLFNLLIAARGIRLAFIAASVVVGIGISAAAVVSERDNIIAAALSTNQMITIFKGKGPYLFTIILAKAFAIAVAAAVSFAIAVTIAIAASFSVAIPFTIAVFLGIALTSSVAFSEFTNQNVYLLAVASQFTSALWVRRQARRGEPRQADLRNIIIALASIGGARLAGADLTEADLQGTDLGGADLRWATLRRTRLRGAKALEWARFSPGPLNHLPLLQLLAHGNGTALYLAGRDLSETALSGADLRGANLYKADLRGACLDDAKFDGANLTGARIDALTYICSRFSPEQLVTLHARGVEIIALQAFPLDAQELLMGGREGLKLYFNTRLSAFNRLLVDGVIVGVLGRSTSCHCEYTTNGNMAIVRIFDAPRGDLERVAEALHRRVWEVWEQAEAQTTKELALLHALVSTAGLRQGLSDLFQRLTRMELRTTEAENTQLCWGWQNPSSTDDRILMSRRLCVMLLCAHTDHLIFVDIYKHLKLLVNQGAISIHQCVDDLIPGTVVKTEMAQRLRQADVLLVLLSADLFCDDLCSALIEQALQPRAAGQPPLKVIPVPIRPCAWKETSLGALQPLPEDGNPICVGPGPYDSAWLAVASGVRRLALSQGKSDA